MEIFMRNIDSNSTKLDVQNKLASELHSSQYSSYSPSLVNFHVYLFASRRPIPHQNHGGSGVLTLPTREIGEYLLQQSGGATPRRPIFVNRKCLILTLSNKQARPHIVENIRRLPYQDAEALQQRQEMLDTLQSTSISIETLQLGWETRDGCFSVEWQKSFSSGCHLVFSGERREIRINISDGSLTRSIVVQLSQLLWSATGHDSRLSTIFLSLASHPSFEFDFAFDQEQKRQRMRGLYSQSEDPDYWRVLPYASLAIRLICKRDGLAKFRDLGQKIHIRKPKNFSHLAENRDLFSQANVDQYYAWLETLDWGVAFQVEAISRSLSADLQEMLSIQRRIENIVLWKGTAFAAELLQYFAGQVKVVFWSSEDGSDSVDEIFIEVYNRCERDFLASTHSLLNRRPPSDDLFYCYHVSVTPTTIQLAGPLPERSNRVMRMYANDHDCFVRVSFIEENGFQYQHDREIDGPQFIERWVKHDLREGLSIVGRKFQFLGYSQSALKSHTVWFVIKDPANQRVSAPAIIESLGRFDNLEWDIDLMKCPARYGARISQAFTATDPSIVVEADEIIRVDDIEKPKRIDGVERPNEKWCFTDGVGTLSKELARDIWKELQKRNKRSTRRGGIAYPRAFQVRFQGSKGMLSVDYKLLGRAICLRPSMIKFNAPDSLGVEIAQAFVQPSKYYLNRPLIMILEGLGVPYPVFEKLQNDAVQYVEKSTESLEAAGNLFDMFGLGTSFRLSSVLSNLSRLGVPTFEDDFYQQMLEFAKHHILRDLKHHARIPVPDGYTLVGVADIHDYLKEGQVFACVRYPNRPPFYLKGRVVISRSPTIHPGDVQVVEAIGPPPASDRPLPSYLGGGDLDGDQYNVTPMPDLIPTQTYEPAAYNVAPKRKLDRPSTMDDVADFVADYINSDILGLVAITWLVIADQSQQKGIFEPACLELGQLHSDAVDYPKSGQPVPLDKIPRTLFPSRPDWNAPETIDAESSAEFYQSSKAIGRLFRGIDLPALQTAKQAARLERRQVQSGRESTLEDVLAQLSLDDPQDDVVYTAVARKVASTVGFASLEADPNYLESAVDLLNTYALDLQTICASNTVTHHRAAMLTEEEAVVGTIVAKCSQKKRRKDAMAKLRDQTSLLVKDMKQKLAGENATDEEGLHRAWAAWMVSRSSETMFGAKSFGWIALGEVFDVIRAIEQERSVMGF
ncbi:hypothetical protein EW146_g829 [Bondarzewia mesenterica]|uniref:RNA-dependent RNA polymerase n=1 Tax=Bondarzewia mesenterica TaxID=1095465 RepID=A0A4S4MBX6_9AGAM|nr:hypothetical protein EW146_g829 [Bondarzewia mesenterica]